AAVLIEASGLEEVPEAFFVYARVKCDLYRFFPVGGYVSHGTVRKAPPCLFSGRGRSGSFAL
ncbi:hypothetical protein, partial [Phocaeicola vulgatus]|uniref:hypothetical protein n=1 Tax=Phocaeicola vulgatus TaxID=821 RepID=UPI0034A2CF2C